MKYKILTAFHALSLDVVIGALSVGLFAVHVLNISPPWCWWTILATAVWSVYTADHLLDGAERGMASQMFRHQLHFRNRYIFLGLLIIGGAYALSCSLFCFQWKIIRGGLLLGVLILLYLTVVFISRKCHFYFHKELFIALVYIVGIWFAPLIWKGTIPEIATLMILFILFLYGWADGLLIAKLDRQSDKLDNQQSFATLYGELKIKRLITVIIILAGVLSLTGYIFQTALIYRSAFILLLLMDLGVLFLFLVPSKLKRNIAIYRFLLEAIFWIPALIVNFD